MKKLLITSIVVLTLTGFTLNNSALADATATTNATNTALNSSDQTGSDSWITTKVKSQLAVTKDVQASSINVQTNNGVVTLSGVVNTTKGAIKAINIAAKTQGVKSVNFSDLSVKDSSSGAQDAYITAKVKWTLMQAGLTSGDNKIRVTTRAGEVFLKGHVINQNTKNNIEQTVKSVAGVASVQNDLKVRK